MIAFDFAQLRRIGLQQAIAGAATQLDICSPAAQLMRVCAVHRDSIGVHDGSLEQPAQILPRLLHALLEHDTTLAVGDWVAAEPDLHGTLWITAHLSPVTQIARRGNDGRRQVLARNVDTALLVMGLDEDFNARRLERYLAIVLAAHVTPVVVLSKADVADDVPGKLALLKQRLPPHVPRFAIDTRHAYDVAILEPWLGAGQTLVLLGSSGAGKSSLTNTLSAADQATNGVRHGDGRGRHTTTARSLHLCASGACIIDTPGLRSWRADADAQTLAATFDDIAALAATCQFRDCQHASEPGCQVRGAVEADRLRNYHKLLRDARRSEETPLERIAARAKWKTILKAGLERGKDKRR
ncbi:ribosome small subunit-dependent GTPase A [Janthinobacterium sp. GW460P]|uniref:ribosome small subunit-dependent GTPase A n=1 Tax=unclassified Janthinobacterium TaxID=2610881 RepID=UPI000A31FC58|nr:MULTISPECIES: ribosome small subunit-dependent GTPase A [unclassified Janthinobacterium]MCC7703468.1 ribosome small subunit-dependent GTPase A [Janthinobacterium sp. GW460P]MCC7708975.1 ribosome small subunit-dependent GTPase A [Janthinobacterium sp. GW460W]